MLKLNKRRVEKTKFNKILDLLTNPKDIRVKSKA